MAITPALSTSRCNGPSRFHANAFTESRDARPSCATAGALLETHEPEEALREWMNRFTASTTTKRDLKDASQAVIATGVNPFEHSRAKLAEALTRLLAPLGAGVEPLDVMTLLVAIAQTEDPGQRKRSPDLVMDGIRHGAARTAR
ncbi:hypothetical protein [Lentzea xinjiangensis]|uniref:SbtR family transcriptional regulator n=1 Tax=Lentzea xinjiangensis TaxID=402600 RepID=UPI001160659C|nr:hypothetical protein [Lentzea xinjiangensis]